MFWSTLLATSSLLYLQEMSQICKKIEDLNETDLEEERTAEVSCLLFFLLCSSYVPLTSVLTQRRKQMSMLQDAREKAKNTTSIYCETNSEEAYVHV
jgi:hypothetical protein